MWSTALLAVAYAGLSHAWLPASGKIRGVSLGSQFVMEPWMANDEWNKMGCGGQNSELDCVIKLGQAQANTTWATHWATWTTKDDITKMQSYGINTIRIPVGYWLREDLVYSDSEHFPQGGLAYLEQICGWASDAGSVPNDSKCRLKIFLRSQGVLTSTSFYIIIDLHGAPGAQVATNADTGQVRPSTFVSNNRSR